MEPRRPKKSISTMTDDSLQLPLPRCEGCKHQEPEIRANHWLEFDSVEDLKTHIQTSIALEDDRLSIVRSYADTRANWEGLAHPATGARMHWREARQWALRDARRRKETRLQELAAQRAAQAPQEPLHIATNIARIVDALPWSPDRWAQGHLVMIQRGLGAPGREEEALAWCEAMGRRSPADAPAWEDAAEDYRLNLRYRMEAHP